MIDARGSDRILQEAVKGGLAYFIEHGEHIPSAEAIAERMVAELIDNAHTQGYLAGYRDAEHECDYDPRGVDYNFDPPHGSYWFRVLQFKQGATDE
jgi:hypothetical protein